MNQSSLIEIEPTPLPARPNRQLQKLEREIEKLEREREDLRGQIEWLEEDIERVEGRICELRDGAEEWPDASTLLAVYGAPSNWPVEPA